MSCRRDDFKRRRTVLFLVYTCTHAKKGMGDTVWMLETGAWFSRILLLSSIFFSREKIKKKPSNHYHGKDDLPTNQIMKAVHKIENGIDTAVKIGGIQRRVSEKSIIHTQRPTKEEKEKKPTPLVSTRSHAMNHYIQYMYASP